MCQALITTGKVITHKSRCDTHFLTDETTERFGDLPSFMLLVIKN